MLVVDQEYVERLKKEQKKKPRLSTLYGMDRIFRLVYKIPFYIPVAQCCLLEHGVNFQFSLFFERLKSSKNELIFLDNSHRVNEFEKQTENQAYAIGPLYPKYRRFKNIVPKLDRKGTLAFPSHSSSQFDFSEGYSKYAEDLKKLPDEFQPVTICLYYYDILQGHHQTFTDAGFTVITNGYVGDAGFVDRLYDHISSFQYITSNHTGSYSFYALEMGIPFFLYGDDIDNQLLKFGTLNGIDMGKYLEEDFLKNFTANLNFDLNYPVTVTPELDECIAYIQDENNQLDPLIVQKLVKRNWWKLILKKGLSYLNG